MKPIHRTLITALALAGAPVFAEEIKKAEVPGQTKIDVGPISVSVSVTGKENGKPRKTPFLGVVTGTVSPQLRAQLDLPEGMGLSVEAVAKDSPAAKAGIREYDVLKKFNDQMLCAQEQLSVLVKSAGAGSKVALVVLRGGREQQVEVTLGEHDAPEGGKARFSINGVPGVSIEVQNLEKMIKEGLGDTTLPDVLNFSQSFSGKEGAGGKAGIQQNWQEGLEKQKLRQKEIQEQIEQAKKQAQKQVEEVTKAVQDAVGGARAQVFSFYPGNQSQSVVTVSDADGTIEINDTNGKRTVKIKDPSGKEIHAGPLNTEADRDAVPEKFRAKVKDAEGKIQKPAPAPGVLKKKTDKKPEVAKEPGKAI